MTVITLEDIKLSKSPMGQRLMSGLLQELHRRGIRQVRGETKNQMRRLVAETLKFQERLSVNHFAIYAADRLTETQPKNVVEEIEKELARCKAVVTRPEMLSITFIKTGEKLESVEVKAPPGFHPITFDPPDALWLLKMLPDAAGTAAVIERFMSSRRAFERRSD